MQKLLRASALPYEFQAVLRLQVGQDTADTNISVTVLASEQPTLSRHTGSIRTIDPGRDRLSPHPSESLRDHPGTSRLSPKLNVRNLSALYSEATRMAGPQVPTKGT